MQRARSRAVSRIVGLGLASVLFLEPLPAVAQDVSLVDAVRSGDRETVTGLLESGLSASSAEPDGTAALHWASQRDDLSMVQLLLAFGAEVDAPNRYGVTPLMLAVTNGSPLVVEALIGAGASVDGVMSGGDTCSWSRRGPAGLMSWNSFWRPVWSWTPPRHGVDRRP